jgi:hypothetical protein
MKTLLVENDRRIDFGPLQGRPDPRTPEEIEAGQLVTLINAGELSFGLEALAKVIAAKCERGKFDDDLIALAKLQAALARNLDQIYFK